VSKWQGSVIGNEGALESSLGSETSRAGWSCAIDAMCFPDTAANANAEAFKDHCIDLV
jgi:hypothetical protein